MIRITFFGLISFILIIVFTGTGIAEDAMDKYRFAMDVGYGDAVGADERSEPEDETLDAYLRYAALNSPALEASFNRWKAELETIPQAAALPDPRLTYAYYLTNVETRVGPQRHKIDLSQMIPWFGTLRLRGEVSLANADIKWQEFQERKQMLYYMVRTAYYNLFLLSRRVAIVRENMLLLRSLEDVIRARYSSGTTSYSDLIRVQVELGKLEERLQSLEDTRLPLAAKLNAAMNRPAGTAVTVPDSLPPEQLDMDDERLIERALEHNPGLLSLDAMRERADRAGELAGRAFWPSVTLGLSWIETGDARMSGVDESGKDPVMPMISINLPVWRSSYHAAVNEAAYRKRAAEQTLYEQENALIADLQMALYNYRDAERKESLYYNSLLPKARQAFSVALAGFESDGTDFTGLIDAQRTLLEFTLAYEEAIVARATALADIELLSGGMEPAIGKDGER